MEEITKSDKKKRKIVEFIIVVVLFFNIFAIAGMLLTDRPFLMRSKENISFQKQEGYVWLQEPRGTKGRGSLFFANNDNSMRVYLVCSGENSDSVSYSICQLTQEIRNKKLTIPVRVSVEIGEINNFPFDIIGPKNYLLKKHIILEQKNN